MTANKIEWQKSSNPPAMRPNGRTSNPVLVLLDNGETILAEYWLSSAPNQSPKWFISREITGKNAPFVELCDTVIGWVEVEETRILNGRSGTIIATKIKQKKFEQLVLL